MSYIVCELSISVGPFSVMAKRAVRGRSNFDAALTDMRVEVVDPSGVKEFCGSRLLSRDNDKETSTNETHLAPRAGCGVELVETSRFVIKTAAEVSVANQRSRADI